MKKTSSQQEYESYHNELMELQDRKEQLEEQINQLKTERGREEEYRERFNVVRQGERLIRVIEKDSESRP